MPSKRPCIMIRTNQEIIEKFAKASEAESRSMSNMGEYLIKKYLEEWESKNERAELKGKLSESKIG